MLYHQMWYLPIFSYILSTIPQLRNPDNDILYMKIVRWQMQSAVIWPFWSVATYQLYEVLSGHPYSSAILPVHTDTPTRSFQIKRLWRGCGSDEKVHFKSKVLMSIMVQSLWPLVLRAWDCGTPSLAQCMAVLRVRARMNWEDEELGYFEEEE